VDWADPQEEPDEATMSKVKQDVLLLHMYAAHTVCSMEKCYFGQDDSRACTDPPPAPYHHYHFVVDLKF
jgi:hypothetical protein